MGVGRPPELGTGIKAVELRIDLALTGNRSAPVWASSLRQNFNEPDSIMDSRARTTSRAAQLITLFTSHFRSRT